MDSVDELRSNKLLSNRKKSYLWLFLLSWTVISASLFFFTNFAITASKSARGDLNHDGTVNAQDAAILASNREDKIIVEKESPKARTSAPVKVVTKPVITLQ